MKKKLLLSKRATLLVMDIVYECELEMNLTITGPYVAIEKDSGKKAVVFKVVAEFDKSIHVTFQMIIQVLKELNIYEPA